MTRHRSTGRPRLLAVSIGMPDGSSKRTATAARSSSEGCSPAARWRCRAQACPRRRRPGDRASAPASRQDRRGATVAEHPRDPRRPAARAGVGAGVARARRAAAEPRVAAQRVGQLRRSLHRVERLLALARGAADRPVLPPDRLHDHRPQQAEHRLPDVGDAAAGTGLRDDLVGQVAPEPRREGVATSPMASPEGPIPRPTALPGRARRSTRRSSTSSRTGSTTSPATGRGARRSRW